MLANFPAGGSQCLLARAEQAAPGQSHPLPAREALASAAALAPMPGPLRNMGRQTECWPIFWREFWAFWLSVGHAKLRPRGPRANLPILPLPAAGRTEAFSSQNAVGKQNAGQFLA